MRARNREVNIFNMSLLDILTGMMGAFLFLMLGMVPYYAQVKSQEKQHLVASDQDQSSSAAGKQEGPQIDTLLHITANWNSATPVNAYLYSPSTKAWDGTSDRDPLLPKGVKIQQGSANGGDDWAYVGDYAYPDVRYLLVLTVPVAQIPRIVDPKGYARFHIIAQLSTLKSDPNAGGVASFSPRIISFWLNTSEVKPGGAYAAFAIEVSKDSAKKEYYQQYTFSCYLIDPAKDKVPPGLTVMQHPW
jgi:hypothetical protein